MSLFIKATASWLAYIYDWKQGGKQLAGLCLKVTKAA